MLNNKSKYVAGLSFKSTLFHQYNYNYLSNTTRVIKKKFSAPLAILHFKGVA